LGANELPQVGVSAKSLASAPGIVIAVIESVATLLAFVKVTTFGLLVVPTVCARKRTLGGDNAAAVPVPCTATVCGAPSALSEIDKVAVLLLIDFGENVTLIVQLLSPGRLDPQLFVCAKSPGSVPVNVIEETATALGVVLVTVTGSGTLLVAKTCVLNFRLVGETTISALSKTETRLLGAVGSPPMVTTRSCLPSPSKSLATTALGAAPAKKLVRALKPPLPSPKRIDTLSEPELVTARSIFPSPSKSAATIDPGLVPAG